MKQSHVVLLGALGFVALLMVGSLGWLRYAFSSYEGADRPIITGRQASRTYDYSGFSAIDVSGQWEVTVTQGTDWQVEVSYPEGLEDRIEVRLDGSTLDLGGSSRGWGWGGFGGRQRLTARITLPALEELDLSGASAVEVSGFTGDELRIDASGAVHVEGTNGRFERLDLDVSGAGNIDLRGVSVRDARVDLSGATNVTLTMDGGELTGNISGAGNLMYYGDVREQSVRSSGFTSIHRGN